ncbi:putative pseudouridine synthase I, TruA, pseudouridine synthase, catalytic domain superfamily [Helianthus annuus]|uniref:tRNA pseudouridine synthase n=1 Tax=Helianthus annuus TaxID=4232 RepID=A0A9K3HUM7_HELAN|nr:putative pseudouridine synthase I, TruA, pseudouridine synthase, catalytic domain superfamily [Helianthus annuus]KAJ0512319.1 putative pseudouridine synthase I, TruA, pseudouridine synthase, catalytic domain superfamily [Helianthus annuus]KAJ0519772.1 putative pseudouridine synthase I, TruA, pseudouridine synthase, catalytic domain superfamily [Helianthus annuus]KAJ0528414.1 putative pseudouridine synthase I, TruA, pseudouridine synthase, catalytic domain superfamily [Helianthus annuus]
MVQGPILHVEVEGSGFMYRQVRNMINGQDLMLKYTGVFYDLMMKSSPYTCVDQWPGFVHSVRKYISVHSRTPPSIQVIVSQLYVLLSVALLLQIGKEAIPPETVPKILATCDRKELAKVALVAPPHGLCLVEVKYKEEHL